MRKQRKNSPIVVSYGGGVNSTAMLIGCHERGLPIDLILFSDTGGEKPETYEYVGLFSNWLVSKGLPPITTVNRVQETLEQECLRTHSLPSIVVGVRSCSDKFKIRPQKKYLSTWRPAIESWQRGIPVTRYIGFDAGEPWRQRESESRRFTNVFPLIDWGWGRNECVQAIQLAQLPVPPKSSCFFCPEMREKEIRGLREAHPDLFNRAIAMEEGNTSIWSVRGLARKYSWKEISDFQERQFSLLPERLPCVCFDGQDE